MRAPSPFDRPSERCQGYTYTRGSSSVCSDTTRSSQCGFFLKSAGRELALKPGDGAALGFRVIDEQLVAEVEAGGGEIVVV